MCEAFAHVAVLDMGLDADTRAPGAAITVALCGHWKHEPPCPVAPRHNHVDWVDGEVRLRTLFVAEPQTEPEVRRRIEAALLSGQLRDTDGVTTRWQLLSNEPSAVSAREKAHAHRLTQT
ncbi:MAG: hypothetical protein M3228_14360 [Actinomycetota bacterium]|nr:hypothetical protein [Actinomycetota bacterium]